MNNIIECRNLNKSYGRKAVLKNINFDIQAGKPVALVGPNGAGKSTLFSLLSGYIHPSNGEVKVLGKPVGSPQLMGCIGTLPQDALLNPNLTIFQQLCFFARLQGFDRSACQVEVGRVLELMKLSNCQNQKAPELSHGMKKRVSIAQALIGQPKLVLLDEPTAGLDPENARNIRQQVTELAGDTTFVISSHNLSELERLCDQVLHLENGELKTQQIIGASSVNQTIDYLSLRFQQTSGLTQGMTDIKNKIAQLEAVLQVDNKQGDELIIRYDRSKNALLDQQILQLLVQVNLPYRQMTQGQSLEDQLFMN
jgi:ABC-2 type transport system ATP-binding protein